jgi:hypothetical protein
MFAIYRLPSSIRTLVSSLLLCYFIFVIDVELSAGLDTTINPMDSLPTETILHVISFLSTNYLKHFSLVSTRFTTLAQPALFKTIHMPPTMGYGSPGSFSDFVDVIIRRPQIGLMIKKLIISHMYDESLHYQPLVQLLEQVHDLRELLCYTETSPSILFRPNQFPQLHRVKWPLTGTGTDILHTLLPYSPVIDLYLYRCPTHLQSKVAFTALLEPSSSKWVNNLVKYNGPCYLLDGLSEDAKLLHFCSRKSLAEETLRGLASKRLLSLHVGHDRESSTEMYIPPSLLPSLFPNLQSVACLTVQPGSAVRFSLKY